MDPSLFFSSFYFSSRVSSLLKAKDVSSMKKSPLYFLNKLFKIMKSFISEKTKLYYGP